jgi:hypothetical protein
MAMEGIRREVREILVREEWRRAYIKLIQYLLTQATEGDEEVSFQPDSYDTVSSTMENGVSS